MRYIFYHIFKRLGWTNIKPIMLIKINGLYLTSEEKDEFEKHFNNRFSENYKIIISYEDVEGLEIKTIY